jgi:hypothetical protein
MTIEVTPEMSMQEVVDAMIEIGSDEDQARDFFSRFTEAAIAHPNNTGCDRGMIEVRVRHNLGYIMGYAPTRIDVEMWQRLFDCSHPFYGESLTDFGKAQ